jgi:hypothetical protein
VGQWICGPWEHQDLTFVLKTLPNGSHKPFVEPWCKEPAGFPNFIFGQGAISDANRICYLASRKRIQNKPHEEIYKVEKSRPFIEKRRDIHEHMREFRDKEKT